MGSHLLATRVSLLWVTFVFLSSQLCGAPMPQAFSTTDDIFNQQLLVEYFSEEYYKDRFAGVVGLPQREELLKLTDLAQHHPVLALGTAQVLYMFGWYVSLDAGELGRHKMAEQTSSSPLSWDSGALLGGSAREARTADNGMPFAESIAWDNVAAAADLFEVSVIQGDCANSALTFGEFLEERSCDTRWSHAIMLADFMSRACQTVLGDTGCAIAYETKANNLLQGILRTQYYGGPCCAHWTQPSQFNFNAPFFPGLPSAPVWSQHRLLHSKQPPLVRFLQDHYVELSAELSSVLALPREAWTLNAPGAVSAEHLASPSGWHMLAVVRHGVWNELLCHLAPRTCEILGSRPEIQNCSISNANIMRLSPGGMLKPHFGNAPRLAAHLSLVAPEPDAAVMQVGGEFVVWREGEVLLFDDTHAHWVTHGGRSPRYVLAIWFCHPCDRNPVHSHGQNCAL